MKTMICFTLLLVVLAILPASVGLAAGPAAELAGDFYVPPAVVLP